MHAKPAMTEEVVTGPGGTLANTIVFISQGLPDRDFDPPAQSAVISQKGCIYEPHVIAVQANQKIQVVNSDKTSHNIHPLPINNREWNRSQPAGQPPFEESFAREEISIPVKCNVHSWMRAYIAVFRHPWFSVTTSAGNFELKNVPAGTYTVQAWHERYGTLREKITVSANETKQLEFAYKARPGVH
jgi:plastocyanin